MITIAVVTIAAAARVGAVEDDGHVVEFLVVIVTLDNGNHIAVHQAGADDKDSHVGPFGNYARVGYNVNRGTIEEDGVVLLA